jgi:hypothetical protein
MKAAAARVQRKIFMRRIDAASIDVRFHSQITTPLLRSFSISPLDVAMMPLKWISARSATLVCRKPIGCETIQGFHIIESSD